MDQSIYEKYISAGKIAAEARDYGKKIIKADMSCLELANSIEKKIIDKNVGIAFPVNISINDVAAHYSPTNVDKLIIKKGDVVKIDVGTHVDGYIADTALTVEVGSDNHEDMIKASEEGLEAAINNIKAGLSLSSIGKLVEDKISSYGFKPVDNLTGHSLQRYLLHGGLTVPSINDLLNREKPKVDDVIAIEPFATNGGGHVVSGEKSNIYLCKKMINPRLIRDKRLTITFNRLKKEFKSLPFAQRWYIDKFGGNELILRKLVFSGLVKQYPQLIDIKNGIVTQKEHTVIIKDDGCEVIT